MQPGRGVDGLALLWHLLDTNLRERFSYDVLLSSNMQLNLFHEQSYKSGLMVCTDHSRIKRGLFW